MPMKMEDKTLESQKDEARMDITRKYWKKENKIFKRACIGLGVGAILLLYGSGKEANQRAAHEVKRDVRHYNNIVHTLESLEGERNKIVHPIKEE